LNSVVAAADMALQWPHANHKKDQKGDMLADPPSMLHRWKHYFGQLLNVRGVNDYRQAEIRSAELHVLKPSVFDIELATEKLARYKSSGVVPVPAELMQAAGRAVCSEIYELINCIWNMDDLSQQWKRVNHSTHL
jgi:hypothetical protein